MKTIKSVSKKHFTLSLIEEELGKYFIQFENDEKIMKTRVLTDFNLVNEHFNQMLVQLEGN